MLTTPHRVGSDTRGSIAGAAVVVACRSENTRSVFTSLLANPTFCTLGEVHAVASSEQPRLLVVEIAEPEDYGELIAGLRRSCPRSFLLAYARSSRHISPMLLAGVRSGLDGLAFWGQADLSEWIRSLTDPVLSTTLAALQKAGLHPLALEVADRVVAQCESGPNVALVARALDCSPRTLERSFAKEGLDEPRVLIALVRTLIVVSAIEVEGCSMSHAVRRAGYPSKEAFHLSLRHRPLCVRRGIPRVPSVMALAGAGFAQRPHD